MSTAFADLDFTTAAAVEDTFPLALPLPLSAIRVRVARVKYCSDASVRYAPIELTSHEISGKELRVDFVSGLEPSTRYVLTLEVSDDA